MPSRHTDLHSDVCSQPQTCTCPKRRTDGETDHSTNFLRISKVLDRIGLRRPSINRWVAAGEFPQANRYLCELCRLAGVQRRQVDGPAHRGWMTYLNTSGTLQDHWTMLYRLLSLLRGLDLPGPRTPKISYEQVVSPRIRQHKNVLWQIRIFASIGIHSNLSKKLNVVA